MYTNFTQSIYEQLANPINYPYEKLLIYLNDKYVGGFCNLLTGNLLTEKELKSHWCNFHYKWLIQSCCRKINNTGHRNVWKCRQEAMRRFSEEKLVPNFGTRWTVADRRTHRACIWLPAKISFSSGASSSWYDQTENAWGWLSNSVTFPSLFEDQTIH